MRPDQNQNQSQVRRGSEMPGIPKRLRMICALMAFNIVACVFLRLSLLSIQGPAQKIRVPTGKFWKPDLINGSFWNMEQQRLDFINNPNFKSSMMDLKNDSLPKSDPCEADTRIPRTIKDYNLLPKLFQDFLLYSHCTSFPMLINQPSACEGGPFLLLAVKTLVPHFERRQAIRETWGRAGVRGNRTVATVFLVGDAVAEDRHPNLTALLRYEAELHRDVLQWEYRDTFLNLTLKDVLFLDWFSSFCPEAQFVLKGDDDVFVNTPRILDFLDQLSPGKAADLFLGDVISNAGPHRNKKLKYYVPESYFVGGYPPYAGGGGFLYSGQVALQLHRASKRVVVYPIDDVYTGMCLRKAGLAPEKHKGFRTFDISTKDKENPCIYRTLMVVHSRTPREIKHIWDWIVTPELECQ